jgi:hypothetical protein
LKKNDEERKNLLFQKLTDETTGIDIVPGFPFNDLLSSYQHRSFAQVAFIAVVQQEELAALQACIEAKKKVGELPADEAAFKVLIEESASSILKDRKPLTGRLLSGQVWLIWQEYTAPDSGKP